MANDPITKTGIEVATRAARRSVVQTRAAAAQLDLELVHFKTGDKSIEFSIDITADTVWATQHDMADLFEVARSTVAEHIQTIIRSGELDEKTCCRKFRQVVSGGREYEVLHYNLDMILSVGYRVSSPKATRFRQWATQTLRSYLVDGYVLNEERLRTDPASTQKLAAKLREIRADERNVYASVREYFKTGSSDYDAKSAECRTFYATLQDKFHYAITSETACEIIISRADHKKPAMGLTSFDGNIPSMDEAQIAKNYLERDELYTMHILCEQFLLYVESKAIRNKVMTMAELASKLDELLRLNDYPVFAGYKAQLKNKAVQHAKTEYALFRRRLTKDDLDRIAAA